VDLLSDMRTQGAQDIYVDKFVSIGNLLQAKSVKFRKMVVHFSTNRVLTPVVAQRETNIQRNQVIIWCNQMVECGICGTDTLEDHLPHAPANVKRTKIYYLERSLIPVFLEKYYSKYLEKTSQIRVRNGQNWRCPSCGVYYDFPIVYCRDCKIKLPEELIPEKIRVELI
jgi:hypothetical protein